MSNKEFIKYISNEDDFTRGIQLIDSILNTNQNFNQHKKGLLFYHKGVYLFEANKYVKAIAYGKKGLYYFEKENHKINIAVSNNLLGKANMYLEKYTLAKEQLNKALTIFKMKGDVRNQIPALQSLAYIQIQNNDFTKAIKLLEKTITLANKIKDSTILPGSYNNIGFLNSMNNNNVEAIKSFKKSIYINDKIKKLNSSSLINLGDLYFAENNLNKSVKLYEKALVFERKKNNLNKQKEIYDFLLDSIKDVKFDYLKAKYAFQRDSINNLIAQRTNEEKIKEVENQYKLVTKEGELKHQKALKKSFLIGFLIVLIPIIGLLYMYYQKIQSQSELHRLQEEMNLKEKETLLKDQELNLIKASIKGQEKARERIAQELHDSIGGNLAGIKLQLAKTSKNDEKYKIIAKQIDDTYEQVRNLSHNLIPQKFEENTFTLLMEEYINTIQKGSSIKIIFSPHPKKEINKIDKNLQVTLFGIIQELITNTLKHAAATQIDIHLSCFKKTIKLLFEDNGIGFNPKNSKNGIGFTNINNRLDKISGTLRIDSFKGRGTIIDIDIPI